MWYKGYMEETKELPPRPPSLPRRLWSAFYLPILFVGLIYLPIPLDTLALETAYALAIHAAGILVFALLWRKTRTELPRYEHTRLVPLTAVCAVLGYVGIYCLELGILDVIFIEDPLRYYSEFAQEYTGVALVLETVFACIAAPFSEELLFRGLVFNRLNRWLPLWAAVCLSSALFGLAHFSFVNSTACFITGIIDCLLYVRYRNLWVPILAHMAYNTTDTLMMYVVQPLRPEWFRTWQLLIPGLLMAGVCAWLLLGRTQAAKKILDNSPQGVVFCCGNPETAGGADAP
jgi:membrane protease YdiL (CAAX protease family)